VIDPGRVTVADEAPEVTAMRVRYLEVKDMPPESLNIGQDLAAQIEPRRNILSFKGKDTKAAGGAARDTDLVKESRYTQRLPLPTGHFRTYGDNTSSLESAAMGSHSVAVM
jgi:hypothetical protein